METTGALEKQGLEIEVKDLLQRWQESVQENSGDKDEARKTFLNKIKLLPPQYKSILLTLSLDANDQTGRTDRYIENLRNKLGLTPLDKDGLEYDMQILIPRDPSMEGIDAVWGSQVRERYFSKGEITTVRFDIEYDKATRDDICLVINPAGIGALSLADHFGKYRVFSRQISNLRLDTNLPTYLKPAEVNFVNRFYGEEK